jgi:hypothetical protein
MVHAQRTVPEDSMFEPPPQEKPSPTSTSVWIGVIVVVIVVAAVMLYMMVSKGPAVPTASAPAAPTAKADPVHDLKIQRAAMDKDSSGTIAVWAIAIENRSPSYSYSNIEYETSYLNADGKVIASNKGTLSLTLGPQEQKSAQLRDLTYPSGTATYKIRVTSATSQAE